MGRIKPLWQLQREVEYAQKRETFLKRTDRPVKPTVDARPKGIVGYRSSLIKIGTTNALIELQASSAAITRFDGVAALGLLAADSPLMDEAIKEPKGFKPAMIHGVVGATSPTVATAAGSGRRYIKYNANATGNAQSSFSAPVSSGDTSPLAAEQAARAKTVADAVAASFQATPTGYGRLWFEAEQYSSPLV
jgi:hypothetical protein